MLRVLVVDDEQTYRDHLALYLTSQGHEVRTAATGREAIDIGTAYRPDVLVADWMLKCSIHGLHVSSVIQAVHPQTKTILITGFASADLKSKARKQVLDFIEKPFEPDRLEVALKKVEAKEAAAGLPARIPIVETNAAGKVLYANPSAGELFSEAATAPESLSDFALFDLENPPDFDKAAHAWVNFSPVAKKSAAWQYRGRQLPNGNYILVLLEGDEQPYFSRRPVIHMLLETQEQPRIEWPFKGHALVIDDDELYRSLVVAILEKVGCLCHSAESHERGMELFRRDAEIRFVILDHDMPGDLPSLVNQLSALRSGLAIIGNSGYNRFAEFAAAGVRKFIAKPWRIEDLIELLQE